MFCSGKIVSPKWKSFKGLRLLWRDKIRLNNAIWRAWFIQCELPLLHRRDQTSCESRIDQESSSNNYTVTKCVTVVFRCGEEEEPSVRVCHPTGGLWGRCTSEAWSERLFSKGTYSKLSWLSLRLGISPSTGDRVRGQLLEAAHWGGDQGVSQVEDLL